ncbi:MAG: hypothetical protein Q8O82_02080 [Pseudorhodobacter sp.]|nr:hypothetical protein [Pseudorhodobacter sp.]
MAGVIVAASCPEAGLGRWGIWQNAAGAKVVDPGQGLQLDNSLIAFEIAAQGGGIALVAVRWLRMILRLADWSRPSH